MTSSPFNFVYSFQSLCKRTGANGGVYLRKPKQTAQILMDMHTNSKRPYHFRRVSSAKTKGVAPASSNELGQN